MSERSGGSRHPHCGRHPSRITGGYTKINLPVFQDEDTKDSHGIIPRMLSSGLGSQTEVWLLLFWTTQMAQDHGGLPKGRARGKMYSNYLRAAREAKKEEAMEPSWNQVADKPSKPKATSFFPLWKLKGTQPTKIPVIRVVHVEEEGSQRRGGCWKWRPRWHQWHDRGIYSMPGKGGKGDPEGWKVLLPL